MTRWAHSVRPVIIESTVSSLRQGPDGIQPCIPVTISIDAATSSYRCKIKQDILRAHSQYANVFYPRYSRVLRQKLHEQTSASPAPRELSLMLRQKKNPQIFVTLFNQVEHACTLQKKNTIISCFRDCAALERERI